MTSTVLDATRPEGGEFGSAPALPTTPATLEKRQRHLGALLLPLLVFVPTAAILGSPDTFVSVLPQAVLISALWAFALNYAHRLKGLRSLTLEAPIKAAYGTAIGLAVVSVADFWRPELGASPQQLLVISGVVFCVATAFELVARRVVSSRERVLVVGLGGGGAELIRELADDADSPFDCVGVVDPVAADASVASVTVLGAIEELDQILDDERPDIVVLSGPEDRAAALPRLLDAAALDFRVVDIHHFYERAFGRVPLENLTPIWFMSILHLYQHSYSRLSKRALDVTLAAFGLIVTAPFFPLIAWLVRRSGPGPVFYRQVRLGECGKTFEMLKFRTMVGDAEARGTAVWAEENDPRITSVGRVLRKTRIDELPQLWNVLRGEMSIVGPRPERPEFVAVLEQDVPFWTRRHLVKPGLTGWAQVRRGYTSDVMGTADKLSYDLYYIKHRSLFLDLAIVIETVSTIARRRERLAPSSASSQAAA